MAYASEIHRTPTARGDLLVRLTMGLERTHADRTTTRVNIKLITRGQFASRQRTGDHRTETGQRNLSIYWQPSSPVFLPGRTTIKHQVKSAP